MNVSASLLCDNNTAVVSWQHSPSAMSYNVMASGRDGDTKRCTTNTTSCLLPNMHCAQTYIITVTPFSKRCKGRESLPRTYLAGPCPPTNVQVSLQCVGNVGHVSWTAALQADMYVASTVPTKKDKHFHNCSSVETNCSITDLHCSETHEVIVVTIERGCTSEPSTPVIIETVICPPAGLMGVTSCSNNDITVSWDPSPESGVDYFLYKQIYTGGTAVDNTTQTSQLISPLPCGEIYTFAVAAAVSGCTSVFSQQIETETAPCPPTNLTVKTDCGTNTATLSWSRSAFATSYTATVTSDAGRVVSCSTNTTSCSVTVDCGTNDSAVVVASSATCDSGASAPLTFTSAPCLPDKVQAELDCNLNTFAVRWQGGTGYVSVYTAIAIGSDGTRQTCNSTETQCSIQSLTCGLLYSIVITTSSIDCGTIEASNYKLHSAPCTPDSVLVDLQCSTNVASVTWGNSGPDQSQVVTAVDSRGMTTTRNTNSSNYTFDQLTCGNKYSISVVGRTDTCSSKAAVAEQLNTGT
ncbi:fibronectin type III domain-containing protein 7-like [Embiotoca jacksoni]|uniref:fibronectin type III domain-containing protein 7-like n=1 Tax=Embiotoca jacksoni TaxID=100190 RepID=UPI003704B4B4